MVELTSLLGQMEKPVDKDMSYLMLLTTDTVLTIRDSRMSVVASDFERRYEVAVNALREFAISEEDQRELDKYLDDKRRTIAKWLRNCHRCHVYVFRSLMAQLQGNDPIANPYEGYWLGSLDELHKML